MESTENIRRSVVLPIRIPTNRDLTLTLIGSIIRFAIDAPQLLLRGEEITPDKVFFLLLPIVRNLGKLIARIRCSGSTVARVAPNVLGHAQAAPTVRYHPRKMMPCSARNPLRADDGAGNERTQPSPVATGGRSVRPEAQKKTFFTSQRSNRRQLSGIFSALSDEDARPTVRIRGSSPGSENIPARHRQLFVQKDGNYAIREITDKRNIDGSVQRITRTISGPDIKILTNISSQLAELPSLTVELSK